MRGFISSSFFFFRKTRFLSVVDLALPCMCHVSILEDSDRWMMAYLRYLVTYFEMLLDVLYFTLVSYLLTYLLYKVR